MDESIDIINLDDDEDSGINCVRSVELKIQQCRICMIFNTEMVNLYSGIFELGDGNLKSMREVFEEATGISTSKNDRLPKFLCEVCTTRIKQSALLRHQAVESYTECVELLLYGDSALDNMEDLILTEDAFETSHSKVNFSNQCRICMGFYDELAGLFTSLLDIVDGETICLNEAFEEATGITISEDDGLAASVCTYCLSRMKESILLRQQAEKSYKEFTKGISRKKGKRKNRNTSPIDVTSDERSSSPDFKGFLEDFDGDQREENFSNRYDGEVSNISTTNALYGQTNDNNIDSQYYNTFTNKGLNLQSIERPYPCHLCPKRFLSVGDCRKHIRRIHSAPPEITCPVCSKTFANMSSYVIHSRSHTKERPHGCHICAKSFASAAYLQIHLRLHSGEKPYVCEICSKSFAMALYLKSHMRTHTGDRPYVCPICSRAFSQSNSCKDHIRTHTNERRYHCEVCSKAFNTRGNLRAHMQTHCSNRSHVCPVCSKSFAMASYLRIHIRKHALKNLYTCEGCSEIFTTAKKYEKHINNNHCN